MFKFKFTYISDTSINEILFVTLLELRIYIFTLTATRNAYTFCITIFTYVPMCSF